MSDVHVRIMKPLLLSIHSLSLKHRHNQVEHATKHQRFITSARPIKVLCKNFLEKLELQKEYLFNYDVLVSLQCMPELIPAGCILSHMCHVDFYA